MKTTLTKLTLLLAIIMMSNTTQANKVYNGYVKTLLGDTYQGKIKMQTPALNEVRVYFITKDGKKKIFKAEEVKEYSFEVEKWNHKTRQHFSVEVTYVKKKVSRSPIAFGPKEVLLEREIKGVISLYHHFIEKNANIETPLEHVIYVERVNNELVKLTKEIYKYVLKGMIRECTILQNVIGVKGKGFKHIAEIITNYNSWMLENGEEDVIDLK